MSEQLPPVRPRHCRVCDSREAFHWPQDCPERRERDLVELVCRNCGARALFPDDSHEANGVFTFFCDGQCEDRYAARL